MKTEGELLGDYMHSLAGPVNTINVYISPEGGFSEAGNHLGRRKRLS